LTYSELNLAFSSKIPRRIMQLMLKKAVIIVFWWWMVGVAIGLTSLRRVVHDREGRYSYAIYDSWHVNQFWNPVFAWIASRWAITCAISRRVAFWLDVIPWSISTCAILLRWVLEFALQGKLPPECGPFGKRNRSNRFRACDLRDNYFLILHLKICEGYVSDGVTPENDHLISFERSSQCSRHCR
jgi:hypothetical protein